MLHTTPLSPEATFTQADIDADGLYYMHNGRETSSDSFDFFVFGGVQYYTHTVQLASTIEQLWQERPWYPGVLALATDRRLELARIYLDYKDGGRAGLEQGATLCARVVAIDPSIQAAIAYQREAILLLASFDALNSTLRIDKLTKSSGSLTCIVVQIVDTVTEGWTLVGNGLRVSARFDANGNARLCGLRKQQEFLFTIRSPQNAKIKGGVAPAKGGESFSAQ